MLPSSSTDHVTSFAHFYRGEMSRMIAWRDRLDRTTNWAIAASAAMLSVTLSSPSSHHGVILCCMALVSLLLGIEARRYRFYELSHSRVRAMERNYYARMFNPAPENGEEWRKELSAELVLPRYTVTFAGAVSNRLRRNYIWIYMTLSLAWWLKVTTTVLDAEHGDAVFVHSLEQLLTNARVSYIPGWFVIAVVSVCWFATLYLALRPVKVSGELPPVEADV